MRSFMIEAPPAVFILCICGERFELGEGLSPQADGHLAVALEFSKKLVQEPQAAAWESYCMQKPVEDFMRHEDNHPA
jgi:hydrogenase maturation protease